jgi:DNA-binding transcriptional LysR family regulator
MTSRHARLERVGKSNWLSRVDTMRTAIRKGRGEAEQGNRTQGCPLAAASGHLSSLLEPRPDSLRGLLRNRVVVDEQDLDLIAREVRRLIVLGRPRAELIEIFSEQLCVVLDRLGQFGL